MSLGLTDSQYYSDIADAIREKTGSAAALAPSEISAAISGIGVNTTIGIFFNFTPNANTTPTSVMLFKNGNTMYCVYTCNNDEFYYNVATSKIIRTGFYYADTMPSTIPANYSNFLFQNGGDITDVAQSNLGNYFIHSTYDIKDENGNVLIPKDVNIEDFGF